MRKVCPKCKDCDEVTMTLFPSTQYVRMTLSPIKNKKGDYDLNDFDTDIEEEWADFDENGPEEIINCTKCGFEYEGTRYEDAWEQMVWRKEKRIIW